MAEESRARRGQSAPTVWASGAGEDRISYGLPGRDGSLRFRFYRGEEIYMTLVSTVGLRAWITLDRSNGRIKSHFADGGKECGKE